MKGATVLHDHNQCIILKCEMIGYIVPCKIKYILLVVLSDITVMQVIIQVQIKEYVV